MDCCDKCTPQEIKFLDWLIEKEYFVGTEKLYNEMFGEKHLTKQGLINKFLMEQAKTQK